MELPSLLSRRRRMGAVSVHTRSRRKYGVSSRKNVLTRYVQWKVEEARVFIAQFKNACKDRNTHSYIEV